MLQLFIGNFDFEHGLACGQGSLPKNLAIINQQLAPAWVAIANDGDAVWTPNAVITQQFFNTCAELGLPRLTAVEDPMSLPGWFELVFWGENAWAARMANQWKLRWNGCDAEIVRRINSRAFTFELEQRLGVGLPNAAVCRNAAELQAAGRNFSSGEWVMKGEFGGAGREVRFGKGEPGANDLAWAGNRFRRGLSVVIEPKLDRIAEVGLQYSIGRDRSVEFLGLTPLLTRPDGGYLGSQFHIDRTVEKQWEPAVEIAQQVAVAVADQGYFGPLGIDAMLYRAANGMPRFRFVQDINGRYTMGRLSLGCRRYPSLGPLLGGHFHPTIFHEFVRTVHLARERNSKSISTTTF